MFKRMVIKILLASILIFFVRVNLKPYNYIPTNASTIPGGVTFILKRLVEKIQGKAILIEDQKNSFQNILIQRRLLELEELIKINNLDYIETAGSRYMTQVQSTPTMGVTIKDMATKKLETLRNTFEYDSAYWLVLQQSVEVTQSHSI